MRRWGVLGPEKDGGWLAPRCWAGYRPGYPWVPSAFRKMDVAPTMDVAPPPWVCAQTRRPASREVKQPEGPPQAHGAPSQGMGGAVWRHEKREQRPTSEYLHSENGAYSLSVFRVTLDKKYNAKLTKISEKFTKRRRGGAPPRVLSQTKWERVLGLNIILISKEKIGVPPASGKGVAAGACPVAGCEPATSIAHRGRFQGGGRFHWIPPPSPDGTVAGSRRGRIDREGPPQWRRSYDGIGPRPGRTSAAGSRRRGGGALRRTESYHRRLRALGNPFYLGIKTGAV